MIIRIFFILIFSNISYANQLKTITAEQYYQQNPSLERKAILEFITHQFDNKKITQAELDQLWNNKEIREGQKLIRFQIINQKLYADSFDIGHLYFVVLFDYFKNFVKRYQVPDVDFIIHASDEIETNPAYDTTINIPTFLMSKDLNSLYEKNKILMPDAHMVKAKWKDLTTTILAANNQHPWSAKEEKIFWRGNVSGGIGDVFKLSNFHKLPRLSLVIMSKLYPELIDARFTMPINKSFGKDSASLAEILELLFGKEYQNVKPEDHLKYKYLISLDGNTCAWERVPWIMLSNSVLIKQETSKIQWFYPALKAYYNYVPVNERITDLFEQYNWMKNNDAKVRIISENATNFIKKDLMPEDIDSHMAIILDQYNKIQQGYQIKPTLPKEEDVISTTAVIRLLFNRSKKYLIGLFE